VVALIRRVSVVVLTLALVAGNGALCAGWAPTPEARMACCADPDCPMHKSESSGSDHHDMTQAQADACCALSEGRSSEPSKVALAKIAVAAGPGPGTLLPALAPELTVRTAWPHVHPHRVAPIPKYVLFSVFLV
jgi:hypothetical protein